MIVKLKLDDLTDPRIAEFIAEHIRDMRSVSPPESKHALDLEGLKKLEISFWSAWSGETLVGCGAIKRLNAEHAELKSMRTAPSHRRRGVGELILNFMMDEARRRGHRRMSLETGTMPFFVPARRLYAKHGFKPCPPFEGYKEDPYSAFMTREL